MTSQSSQTSHTRCGFPGTFVGFVGVMLLLTVPVGCSSTTRSDGDVAPGAVSATPGNRVPRLEGVWLDGGAPTDPAASELVLVSFWSSDCARAAQVVPRLKEIAATYLPHELVVIGPSADDREAALAFQTRHGITNYRLIYGADGALETFQVTEYPTAFLVDSQGTIAWRGDPTSAELDRLIAVMLAAASMAP